MQYEQLVASLTPDIVTNLRSAVETGRWPDGRSVTPEQKEHSLRAIIAWEQQHLPKEQQVGYIDTSRLAKTQQVANGDSPQQLRWVGDEADRNGDTGPAAQTPKESGGDSGRDSGGDSGRKSGSESKKESGA